VKVSESFGVAFKVVINSEALAERLHVMKLLEVGEVFSGIFLRLLCDEECYVEIVETECGIVELVDIREEANMVDRLLELRLFLSLAQVGDQGETSRKIRRVLAHMRCDDAL
jgi:hypothetical protein